MARVVVDVMPKPEILDPQGKAVSGALARLGLGGLEVRQGKRFEIEVDGELTPETMSRIERAAAELLANTVIEDFVVRAETADAVPVVQQAAAEIEQPVDGAAPHKADQRRRRFTSLKRGDA